MKVYYNAEICTGAEYTVTDWAMEVFSHHLGFAKTDVDEHEERFATALFVSNVLPTEMRDRARALLKECPGIHYIDVMYRFETEMVPDRFVIWSDGRIQEYTGHIEFTED